MLPAVKEPIIDCNPPHYICRRTKLPYPGEPDGKLDKDFWRQTEVIDDFHDIEGDSLPRPLKRTEVRMLWDDEYLYIGAKLTDNEIWATVAGRDEIIFVDNDFEVFLAPEHTSHRYYELEMNALNSVWDLLMEKPARDMVHRICGWDIRGLKSAVHIEGRLNDPGADNKFWSLELLIPWFPLRECTPYECVPAHIVPDNGEYWRLNFSRVEWKVDVKDRKYVKRLDPATGRPYPEYNWVWAPTGVIDIHMPEMWGYLVFGGDATVFTPPVDAGLEWQLRKLYYRQRQYGAVHGVYTTDFEKLRGGDNWPVKPRIDVTPNLFEIVLPASKGTLHIRQDGYLWREA
ncbi:MAG: carbohydrate-binding family 9-like protein [Treponema sp.]|jgi:hypothetical protein|nr:carbohydrate-binding family 9-like protein [Treponema sp.]